MTPLNQERMVYANVISTMAYMLRHDSLTGLLTRDAVINEIDEQILEDQPVGVAILDMDAFKLVNDELGHERANTLLGEFGQHMTSNFRRESDAVSHQTLRAPSEDDLENGIHTGRYGGDEFIMAFNLSDREKPDGLNPTERMDANSEYVGEVIKQFVKRQDEDIKKLGFNVSVGAAVRLSGDEEVATDLIRKADANMYVNKAAHKSDG